MVAISSIDLCVDDSQRDAFAPHHRLGLAHLVAAVLERRVLAVRPPLVADLRQPLRVDGQAEALRLVRRQRRRQLAALEVLRDQRVVGGLDAVLHRQVERGRRLAAAADADQDHVGLRRGCVADWPSSCASEKLIASMRSLYSWLFATSVKRPMRWLRLDAELGLERLDEGAEHVEHQARATAP